MLASLVSLKPISANSSAPVVNVSRSSSHMTSLLSMETAVLPTEASFNACITAKFCACYVKGRMSEGKREGGERARARRGERDWREGEG